MNKISIVIPNFNGKELLEKNLPNILDSGADEILIIDDGSKDNSVSFLGEKYPDIKLLINKKNLGFIPSVNKLFKEATGDIVVLLNNDVFVEKDFLKPLLKHFENPKVFAVNLHEKGEGPAIAFWKDGFFEYKRGEENNFIQKSAWASGGSAAFRKSIWDKLGGFDETLEPFYWEDTDLSFRALKSGYEILWEPESIVKHEHETTISKTHKKRYVTWVQQRNQLLFIWKNITDKNLLTEHRNGLLKRLFSSGFGYIIVYLWALIKSGNIKKTRTNVRTDSEAINYALKPSLSIIIVAYNSEEFIEKCVASVLRNLPENGEIIIIDNDSSDGTVKELEKFGDKIKLIKSSENLGFSKGNNRAAKEAGGEYLFFLNPDTEVEKPIFEELVNFYEVTSDVGIVAPKLMTSKGEIQASVKNLPSVWGAINEFIFGVKNAYSQYVPTNNEPTIVGMVYGAAMLIKRSLFEDIGGFDEKYFLYYEDADFCKRVIKANKKIYFYPKVSINHIVGGTKTTQDRSKLNNDSMIKYHGALGAFILNLIFWIPRLRRRL